MADWIKIGTDYVDLDKVESVVKETAVDDQESYLLEFESNRGDNYYYVDGADVPSFLREMDTRVLLNRMSLRHRLSVWSVDAVTGAADGPMPEPAVEEAAS